MSPVLTMQPSEQAPSAHYSNMLASRSATQPEVQQTHVQSNNFYQQRDEVAMNGEHHYGHENGFYGLEGHDSTTSLRQHSAPFAGPVVAATRQNSTSSTASSGLNESSEHLLRQTLSTNGQAHSDNKQSRKKNFSSVPTTSRITGASSLHTSLEYTVMEAHEEAYPESDGGIARHGFEDEYNSEAYLALLEQVGRHNCFSTFYMC